MKKVTHKTCDELGVCQALCDCNQCHAPYPFAPGVIERQPRRRWLSAARVEAISRAVLVLGVLAALLAILGVSAGWLPGGLL